MQPHDTPIEVRVLGPGEEAVLAEVEPEVFDKPVVPQWVAAFLAEPTHHLAVALHAGRVIGFVSAVRYLHPDKAPQLWINEVGVAPKHQRMGVATRLMDAMLEVGRKTGCSEAWVLTGRDLLPAQQLYRKAGGREVNAGTVMFEFRFDGTDETSNRNSERSSPIRQMHGDDRPHVLAMMQALWPDAGEYDFSDESVLVWERPDGRPGAFISFSLRPWAEGCMSEPVPYVEGWWVDPDLRRRGVGRALMDAVVQWCREHGYRELGSDVEPGNAVSLGAHSAMGFEPTLQVQFLRKRLD